jgi:hypothetical protein
MTSNSANQLYKYLTPRERLFLIVAAFQRGDAVEKQRLVASAPMECFEQPDYAPHADALNEIVNHHLFVLLDLGMHFWRWWGLLMIRALRAQAAGSTPKGRRRKTKAALAPETRAGCVVSYYATRFVAHVDGWKQFCAELPMDPEVLLHFMTGWDNILWTERKARELTFTPEDAAWFVRMETVPVDGDESQQKAPEPVETAAEVAACWHQIWNGMIRDKIDQGPPESELQDAPWYGPKRE